MSMETVTCELNGIQVECTLEVEPYTPAYTSGPPENCYPAEGGMGDIEEITYTTDGLVKVDGHHLCRQRSTKHDPASCRTCTPASVCNAWV